MMQSYMDPRMMSGRPAMDIPPIHPGELKLMLFHGPFVVNARSKAFIFLPFHS